MAWLGRFSTEQSDFLQIASPARQIQWQSVPVGARADAEGRHKEWDNIYPGMAAANLQTVSEAMWSYLGCCLTDGSSDEGTHTGPPGRALGNNAGWAVIQELLCSGSMMCRRLEILRCPGCGRIVGTGDE